MWLQSKQEIVLFKLQLCKGQMFKQIDLKLNCKKQPRTILKFLQFSLVNYFENLKWVYKPSGDGNSFLIHVNTHEGKTRRFFSLKYQKSTLSIFCKIQVCKICAFVRAPRQPVANFPPCTATRPHTAHPLTTCFVEKLTSLLCT